jgi:hypothetical protein|uniref:Uncharacterized protein n=1 Tax=Myoviridae sp. ct9MV2 TaxID=2826625 RepID=A0A8S5NE15_9CAUD|nr:MAG TPA: hypothetical protein [Myoviridae sp. ct9MV2]
MKAIRVYVDSTDTDLIGSVIEKLNSFEDTAANMVAANEIFIAAVGTCAIKYAKCVVQTAFNGELTIQNVK